jgi:hypothetical protein
MNKLALFNTLFPYKVIHMARYMEGNTYFSVMKEEYEKL